MKVKDWLKVPSWWIDRLQKLKYKNDKFGSASGKIASLMIYIAILIEASKKENFSELKISYTTIGTYTGISRSLIRKGLNVLEELEIIQIDQSKKHNSYTLIDPHEFQKKWFKFPAKSLLNKEQNEITSFKNFSLRKRTELHALKILLYIGSVRNNTEYFSYASYDKLEEKLGISRSDIPKALSFLYVNELFVKASPSEDQLSNWEDHLSNSEKKYNVPNKYYLKGHRNFIKK